MKISIAVSDDDIIHVESLHDIEKIDEVLENVRGLLYAMVDKAHRQAIYQKRYSIETSDIINDVNGDLLRIGIDIRGLDDEDVALFIGVQEPDIDDMLLGLVKPSRLHLNKMAEYLDFPVTFFTLEFEYKSGMRFMCKMPEWAG